MKGIFVDLLNGFSVNDFILLFIQVLSASLLSILTFFVVRRKKVVLSLSAMLFSTIIICSLLAFSKHSVPLAVFSLGIALLLSKIISNKLSLFAYIIAAFIGFGCGAGYVLVTAAITVLVILPVIILVGLPDDRL